MRRQICILEGKKLKILTIRRKRGENKAAEALEISDIDSMWALGTLGDSHPEVLLNTVWFLLTLHMGLRGRNEHYKLTYRDLAIQTIPDGPKYVEFNERDTKICSGETNPSRQFKPKMWSTPNNLSRCPLRNFEMFLQKCHPEMCTSESPFYLAVNYHHLNDNIWYNKQMMGNDRINTIECSQTLIDSCPVDCIVAIASCTHNG